MCTPCKLSFGFSSCSVKACCQFLWEHHLQKGIRYFADSTFAVFVTACGAGLWHLLLWHTKSGCTLHLMNTSRAKYAVSFTGQDFLTHFQFGMEAMAALIQRATSSCNTPVQAAALGLLAEVAAASRQAQLLLPIAVIAKLAAAACAALPCAPEGHMSANELGSFQPTQELQVVYVSSCRCELAGP